MKPVLTKSTVNFSMKYWFLMTILSLLVVFNILLIWFNPCFVSIIYPCNSALFRRLLMAWSDSSPILIFLGLKFSRSSSNMALCLYIAFERLFCFRTCCKVLVTIAFRSWTLNKRFLAPWNRTQPAPLPREVYQVDFMALACACITLHEFILCPGTCRDHTGSFIFLL